MFVSGRLDGLWGDIAKTLGLVKSCKRRAVVIANHSTGRVQSIFRSCYQPGSWGLSQSTGAVTDTKHYSLFALDRDLGYSFLKESLAEQEIMRRMRVLLVDDNEMTRALLRMIIVDDEYEVVGEAGDAEKAMQRIRETHPDILCLDVQMGEVSGLELLQAARAFAPRLKVLMVSSSNDRATVGTAIECGAVGYIIKPFTPGIVRAALDRVSTSLKGKPNADRI